MKQDIKEESDDGFVAVNTTQSSCDYSMSQFKDDPLSELPIDVESEEDIPLVIYFIPSHVYILCCACQHSLIFKFLFYYFWGY